MIQKLPAPNRQTYLGKGKLEELVHKKSSAAYDILLFDDELSPMQQENLEKALRVKIIDRVALILDIFASRARTREGKLQVELAQHQYLLPRLAGQWSHLERLGGGIGTRGPGESQLETDRRLIRRRIEKLKDLLESVRRHRELYRQRRRRNGVAIAALVGYTNSGKSTLLNALSQAGVLAEDKLFATLDPTTRQLYLPGGTRLLLTDTVGFIHKLPPDIVEAFRATLEELQEATMLFHVVDITSRNATEQNEVVDEILNSLGLQHKPRITVLNKIDSLLPRDREWDEAQAIEYLSGMQGLQKDIVLISATRRWGLKNLMSVAARMLAEMPDSPAVSENEDAL